MEQILFSSQELDITFNFSDHSISSDEELIPIGCSKPQISVTNTESFCNEIEILDSNAVKSQCNFTDRSKYFQVSQNKQKSPMDDINGRTETSSRTTYYKECPICKALGPKSINHIKQCANKKLIDPKKLVQLLSECQKSDQSIECLKTKLNAKPAQRNKLMDNYVISFGEQKQMKITIDPKIVSNKSAKHLQTKYQLLALDPNERHKLLMSKINDHMISEDNGSTESSDPSDTLLNTFCILPDVWKHSLLDSEQEKYWVEGFEKYDKPL